MSTAQRVSYGRETKADATQPGPHPLNPNRRAANCCAGNGVGKLGSREVLVMNVEGP